MKTQSSELGSETSESQMPDRRLETLDDIPREIAKRRLHAEYSNSIAPEKFEKLREVPDLLEKPDDFVESAREAGIKSTEGILGYSTHLEDPAHVLKADVGQEIATLIHEDLHRMTHPETLREVHANESLRDLYEGVTEHFTIRAADGLHGFKAGECYPEQVGAADKLSTEVGDEALRDWFFKHELTEELRLALDRLAT